MKSILCRGLALVFVALGLGLILNSITIGGIIVLSSGIGLWMADFHLEPAEGRSGKRLVAKGSPVLLLLPLMLSAGQVYGLTTDSVAAHYGFDHQCESASDTNAAAHAMTQ